MKTRLIKKKSIEDFTHQNAGSRIAFSAWLSLLKMTDWKEPGDMAKTFGSSDLLGNGSNRVLFNIGGNHFRMICKYHFGNKMIHLYIKWIGTHAAYSELCNKNGQYTIDAY